MEGYKYRHNEKGVPIPQIEEAPGSAPVENEGLVPRSVRMLFDLINQEHGMQRKKFTIYCSYLQIYKEKIFDLLNKS